MVVQHNLTAMNANRQLGIVTNNQAKATEKLSSGYKINRAGDDAAGLSISEKMRSQIRGMTVSRVLYLTVIYLRAALPRYSSHPGSGRANLLLPYRCCSG